MGAEPEWPVEYERNQIYQLLSDDQRRALLTRLNDDLRRTSGKRRTTLESMATELAGNETGRAFEGRAVDEVTIALHHRHLPKLDDFGVLEYDHSTGAVEYGRHPIYDYVETLE